MNDLLRVYEARELGADGYPPEWHATIKHAVRAEAGNRCVRCHHPYRNGEHGSGEWSACDKQCQHGGPSRAVNDDGTLLVTQDSFINESASAIRMRAAFATEYEHVQAQWRILTVHHLNGDKADCRWWNLAPLCQRCHLTIQGRVVMERAFMFEHSEWFKPYAAGFYASKYLGEDLTRNEAMGRQDELLGLERVA